jgi:hypothetical protein
VRRDAQLKRGETNLIRRAAVAALHSATVGQALCLPTKRIRWIVRSAHDVKCAAEPRNLSHRAGEPAGKQRIPKNMSIFRLTSRFRLIFSMSRLKRGSACTELVLRRFWDCKLALNFVPANDHSAERDDSKVGVRIEFFCRLKCAENIVPKKFGAGSLTSTYRVVSTTLRAESEISGWRLRSSAREFQLS